MLGLKVYPFDEREQRKWHNYNKNKEAKALLKYQKKRKKK